MNITTTELHAIRSILSKKDKGDIAEQAGKSIRTVEAILQGDRVNDQIERLCYKKAKENWSKLAIIFNNIESKNLSGSVSISEFEKLKQSQVNTGEDYNYYMDVYLTLVHFSFKNEEELWKHINEHYSLIVTKSYWCILLFSRLLGITDESAVSFYNSKI